MKKNRILSGFLAVVIAACATVVPATVGATRYTAVQNESGYTNPYVITARGGTARSETVQSGSIETLTKSPNGSIYYLSSAADFALLAADSRSSDMSGKVFQVSVPSITLSASDFIGIGSTANPFRGTLEFMYDNGSTEIILPEDCSALFNCLSSSASVSRLNIIANDATGCFAQTLIIDSSTINISYISVSGNVANPYTDFDAALLFGTVTAGTASSSELDISTVTVTIPTENTYSVSAVDGNAGVLFGTIDDVSIAVTEAAVSISGYTVSSSAGDAGLIAGSLTSDATLTIGNVTVTGSGADVTSYRFYSGQNDIGGNAGAVVGSVGSGCSFNSTGTVTSTGVSVAGGNTAGGIAGSVIGAEFQAVSTSVSNATLSGAVYCGGYIGNLQNSTSSFGTGISSTSTSTPTNDTRFGLVGAGGVFGKLLINGNLSLTLTAVTATFTNDTTNVNGDAPFYNNCAGGAIGIYGADNLSRSLTVSGTVNSAYTTTSGLFTYGGVVGLVDDNSYCLISGVTERTGTVTAGTASANTLYVRHFGGAAALVDDGAFLDINGINVSGGFNLSAFSSKNIDGCGGGIAGYTGKGSALRLNGATVLNSSAYAQTTTTYAKYLGQLVGCQENSLIFAEEDWVLTRNSQNASTNGMDDIGSYGAVIRNNTVNAITVNANHSITLAQIANATASAITLSGLTDYAALAITLNSQGYFSAVTNINSVNYSNLLSSTITIGNNINLTGSGITTLTRSDITTDSFTGTLNGGNKTVTVAVGEQYATGGTHGNGEIYGAKYVGMFASLNGATIRNLTVNGAIRYGDFISSTTLNNDILTYAGGVAGYASGTILFDNVTTDITLYCKNSRRYSSENRNSAFGGILGCYEGVSLSFTGCTGSADINVFNSYGDVSAETYRSGGIVGHIKATAGANVTFNNTTLSGSVSLPSTESSVGEARLGGLVAAINAANSSPSNAVNLTIDNLTVDNQTVVANSTVHTGGLLGYKWDNVNASLTNSTGTNSIGGSLTVINSAIFGGLVYRIDGKFAVDKTTVTGTFTGNNNDWDLTDGLFVGYGTNLYMTVDKPTVTLSATINETKGKRCDDYIGANIGSGSTTTAKYGGILSIETGDGIGSTANYVSVTGKNNRNTRYYYNVSGLDRTNGSQYLADVLTNNTIANRNDLLLWSILNYTASDITAFPAYYFGATGFSTAESYSITSDISMADGFCLYPTSVTGGSYDFGNHSVTFSNTAVSSLETLYSSSQHHLMQTGIFLDTNGNVSVSNLTLAGNVGHYYLGSVGGGGTSGSGALVCGTTSGSHTGTSSYNISYLTLDSIVLNGISVNGCNNDNNYTPLLINKISTCTTLNITDVTQSGYTSGTKAASSLIGKVGFVDENNDSATRLKLEFSEIVLNTISNTSIFYRSSLLDSFQYAADGTSGGYYNFKQEEDWASSSNHIQQVTYGTELTAKKTEYLDTEYKVNPTAFEQSTVYDYVTAGYLPYVYSVDTANSQYTIDVNLKSGDLIKGCGSYEDPYEIKTSNQLMALYRYLEGLAPNEGWSVNSPKNSFCTDHDTHTVITYSTANPTDFTDTISREFLASAYYVLANDIDLSAESYTGLGNETGGSVPFAGVIVGASWKIIMPSAVKNIGSMGFVKVANGCVLKNINIEYSGAASVATTQGSNFGGAIAKIIGGDNIIDNTSVSLTSGSSITVQNRLTYIGGYVGICMAGGVIFRNMTDMPGLTFTGNNNTFFYCNPYVGRVLDGFAVAENGTVLDNTDKNYKIPTLSAKGTCGLTVDYKRKVGTRFYSDVTVSTAEGLYILSAALNSGALSASEVFSYGDQAHVRNSLYTNVGNVSSASDSDYVKALNDNSPIESLTHSNYNGATCVPYLVTNYITTTNNSCPERVAGSFHNNTLYIDADCDVSDYGSAFRGIGGKYPTNAARQLSDGNQNYDRNSFVGYDFYGQDNTVTMDMSFMQYSGDNYLARDVSLIRSQSINRLNPVYSNFIISGSIIQKLYNSDGAEITDYNEIYNCGGLLGIPISSAYGVTSGNTVCTLNNIKAENLTLYSNGNAGGIIGQGNTKTLAINSCSFSGVNLSASGAVGGLVGFVGKDTITTVNISGNTTMGSSDGSVANASQIKALSSVGNVGGLVGLANASITINSAARYRITLDHIQLSFAAGANLDSPDRSAGGVLGRTIKDFSISNVTLQNSSVAGTEYSLAGIKDTASNNVRGSAGGIVGSAENSSDLVKNCTVTSSQIIAGYSAGGIVGKFIKKSNSSSGDLDIENCEVSGNTDIASHYSAGGIIGFSTSTSTLLNIGLKDITVSGISLFSGGADNARAAGIIPYTTSNIILTSSSGVQNLITNNRIISLYASGAVGKIEGTATTNLNNLSVTGCFIGSHNVTDPGSYAIVVNSDYTSKNNTVYMTNITATDNTLSGYASTPSGGGLQNVVYGSLYANNILYKNNAFGRYDGNDDLLTYNSITTDLNDSVGHVVNSANANATVSVNAYSSDVSSDYDIITEDATAKFVVVRADYNGVTGSGNTAATLGEQVAVSPARNWDSGENWHSDGIAENVASQIIAGSRYTSYGTPAVLQATNLVTMNSYYSANTAVTDMPLLYVTGSVNDIISEYLDVLTNGGYSAKLSADASSISVTSQAYRVDSDSVDAITSNNGSIAFSNGVFTTAQNYDNLDNSTGGTFTLVSVTFSNPSSATTNENFTLQFTAYYPQVLSVQSNVRIQDHEEYSITRFVSTGSQSDPSTPKINTFNGGTFSAYFEYVYNDLRLQDDWNYEKTLNVTDSSNRPLILPSGCKLTLVDLNSALSTGYRAYYYDTDSDMSTIPFSAFRRADNETTFSVTDLQNLPSFTGGGIYRTEDTVPAGYGVERYIVVVQLPKTGETSRLLYYINAGLITTAGETRNVTLEEDADINEYITVWPDPTVTGGFSSPSGQTTLSAESEINVELNLNTVFPVGYSVSGNIQYGFIRYYLTDNNGQRVLIPEGTVLTINGTAIPFADDTSDYLTAITDGSSNPVNLANGSSIQRNIQLDFSNVSISKFNSVFSDTNYNLCADYLISSDVNNLVNAIKIPNSILLSTSYSSGASIAVKVLDSSLLHLGINPIDNVDETNNGEISFNVSLNLAECTPANIDSIRQNGSITLSFALYKKNDQNNYEGISAGSCLAQYQTTVALTSQEITELCDSQYKQITKSFTIKLKSIADITDYTNYKYEVSAISTGDYSFNIKDHFIFTLANIFTGFVV